MKKSEIEVCKRKKNPGREKSYNRVRAGRRKNEPQATYISYTPSNSRENSSSSSSSQAEGKITTGKIRFPSVPPRAPLPPPSPPLQQQPPQPHGQKPPGASSDRSARHGGGAHTSPVSLGMYIARISRQSPERNTISSSPRRETLSSSRAGNKAAL